MSSTLVIDAHLHCTGCDTADTGLHTLDEAGIDMAVLLAPFLSEGYSMHDASSLRRGNHHLAILVRNHGDQPVGFAVVAAAVTGRARSKVRPNGV